MDPQNLSATLGAMTEDALFALAGAASNPREAVAGVLARRRGTHTAILSGTPAVRMIESFDPWLISLARAAAPVAPATWIPMAGVLEEKVTLEVGARGIRSLFSSKPSDKDVQRVRRLGTLAVRVLRGVFAADGPIDAEEARTIAALVASFGLPDADAQQLLTEAPVPVSALDVYGDVEAEILRAIVRGAWQAAAWDALDPREEDFVRAFCQKVQFAPNEIEASREEALARVEARRPLGLAAVDGIRWMLADRTPGDGVALASRVGTLMLPRRYREEALGQVAHGAPVTLAKRYVALSSEERTTVLAIAWATALFSDPSVTRKSVLAKRHDAFAKDLEDDGRRGRVWLEDALAEALSDVLDP